METISKNSIRIYGFDLSLYKKNKLEKLSSKNFNGKLKEILQKISDTQVLKSDNIFFGFEDDNYLETCQYIAKMEIEDYLENGNLEEAEYLNELIIFEDNYQLPNDLQKYFFCLSGIKIFNEEFNYAIKTLDIPDWEKNSKDIPSYYKYICDNELKELIIRQIRKKTKNFSFLESFLKDTKYSIIIEIES